MSGGNGTCSFHHLIQDARRSENEEVVRGAILRIKRDQN
jgi:hypothetical protein